MSGEWRWVPVEPTKAMCEAARDVKRRRLLRAVEATRAGQEPNVQGAVMAVREEWDAMLSAIPQQPEPGGLTDEQIEFALQCHLEDPSGDEACGFYAGARWANAFLLWKSRARADEAERVQRDKP